MSGNDARGPVRKDPLPFPMPARLSASQKAADAAAHVEWLEQTVEAQKDEIARINGRLSLTEEANTILHEEKDKAEHDRDYYRDRCTMLVAKLNASAAIILDAVREPIPEPPKAAAATVEEKKES